jgi:hypothetical protein
MSALLTSRAAFRRVEPLLVSVTLGLAVKAITPYTIAEGGERYRYVDMSHQFPIVTCPSFHCFRFLPPLLTRLVPLPTIPAFIVTGLVFQMLAGASLWRITERVAGSRRVALLTTMWFWGSWSSIQAVAEPLLITDPVQAFWSLASLELLLSRRFRLALVMLATGAAVKEGVLLIPWIYAAYVYLAREPARPRLIDLAVLIAMPLVCWLAVRGVLTDHYWYAAFEDPAYLRATYFFGLWFPNLAVWPRNILIAGVYIFGAFGLAWLLAAIGFRRSTRAQRALSIAAIIPMVFLALYQVPDRALASFPYAVLPVAAAYTASLPMGLNVLVILANAVFTERVAATASWAPRIPVAVSCLAMALAVVLWRKTMESTSAATMKTPA